MLISQNELKLFFVCYLKWSKKCFWIDIACNHFDSLNSVLLSNTWAKVDWAVSLGFALNLYKVTKVQLPPTVQIQLRIWDYLFTYFEKWKFSSWQLFWHWHWSTLSLSWTYWRRLAILSLELLMDAKERNLHLLPNQVPIENVLMVTKPIV